MEDECELDNMLGQNHRTDLFEEINSSHRKDDENHNRFGDDKSTQKVTGCEQGKEAEHHDRELAVKYSLLSEQSVEAEEPQGLVADQDKLGTGENTLGHDKIRREKRRLNVNILCAVFSISLVVVVAVTIFLLHGRQKEMGLIRIDGK